MFDIPGIIWYFCKWHPKFVSKMELGEGIPSISFNLKHGGSVLIDRKDPKQSLAAIQTLGEYIYKYNRSAVIFPEGTRSRDGRPKYFHPSGVRTLCQSAPNAMIVPTTINNSWKLSRFEDFPKGLCNRITILSHTPISVNGKCFEEAFALTERLIKSTIKYM